MLNFKRKYHFKLSFITRQANSVAHLLAMASLSYFSSHVHDYEFVIIDEMS